MSLAGQLLLNTMRKVLKRRGFEIVPAVYTWEHQWAETLRILRIDLAFDVGANLGQWYERFRAAGFDCPVVSFEPDPRALAELAKLLEQRADPTWTVQPFALGGKSSDEDLFLWPLTSGSTSLRSVTKLGEEFTGYSQDSLTRSTVQVRRFLDVYPVSELTDHRPLLKIDVQGYEREVLSGMGLQVIQAFTAIEIEIPLIEVYADSASFVEIFSSIADCGFVPYTISSERWHGEGFGVADCDVLMVNTRELPAH